MRCLLSFALLAAAAAASAAEPEVRVFCPAISFDDHDERGRDVPDGPHRVVLMVVGKAATVAEKPAGKQVRRPADDPFDDESADGGNAELIVERVLFGSPPGKKIALASTFGREFGKKDEQESRIYGIVATERNGKLAYGSDDYYFYDRTYALDQLPYAQALGQARLDLLVLSSSAIFIGSPAPAEAEDPGKKRLATRDLADPFADESEALPPRDVTIKRVLHGDLKPGQRIATHAGEKQPIPLAGSGEFLYFLGELGPSKDGQAIHRVTTRWSTQATDLVTESLKRRKEYPIREQVDEGRTTKSQEIVLLGARANAIEMFRSPEQVFEILAARRLISDGKDALSDVVAAIESNLWTGKEENGIFRRQANLISAAGNPRGAPRRRARRATDRRGPDEGRARGSFPFAAPEAR